MLLLFAERALFLNSTILFVLFVSLLSKHNINTMASVTTMITSYALPSIAETLAAAVTIGWKALR